MLLKIFPTLAFRRSAISLMVFCIIFGFVSIGVTAVQCIPISKAWERSEPGSCLKQGSLFASQSIISLVTELLIVLLPAPLVWRLQMPRRQKLLVLLFFSVGLLPSISLVVRLTQIVGGSSKFPTDPTWYIVDAADWVVIEYGTGFICSSLPHLKPLIRKYCPEAIDSPPESPVDPENRTIARGQHALQDWHRSTADPMAMESAALVATDEEMFSGLGFSRSCYTQEFTHRTQEMPRPLPGFQKP